MKEKLKNEDLKFESRKFEFYKSLFAMIWDALGIFTFFNI